ncbi:MAG TPA: DUF3106 domain-containing protein [Candidatus Binatia bacterium]|jgi:hypothetical protein
MFKRNLIALLLCGAVLLPAVGWSRDDKDNWRNLSPREKENVIRNYQRWQNLPQSDKQHLQQEWNRWQSLPPDRRDQIQRRYERERHHRSDD